MIGTNNVSTSFPAIAGEDAETLILGSMPGVESLKQQRYYAHPRNAFWPIMSKLFQLHEDADYEEYRSGLIANRIAVWDVLQSCERQGSLDSNIQSSSIIINDFVDFLEQHQNIRLIVFNGTKAEQIFTQYVIPSLTDNQLNIPRKRAPSTSPAHAAMSFDQKCEIWKSILF